jgi:exopolysaccharide biosynthesis protein
MRNRFPDYQTVRSTLHLVFCLLSCLGLFGLQIYAQDFRTVAPGVEYAQVTREFSGEMVKMNLLRLDLTKVRLDVVHANDMAIGTETVSSMAKRHSAFAAINGGFFRDDGSVWTGDPAGVLQIDRKLLSESDRGRVALGIRNGRLRTTTNISRGPTPLGLTGFEGRDVRKQKVGWPVSGLNREPKQDELVVFTGEFDRTITTSFGAITVKANNSLVTELRDRGGEISLSPNELVVVANGKATDQLKKLSVGDQIHVGVTATPSQFRHPRSDQGGNEMLLYYEDVVGGVPQLIKNGRVEITWEQEKTNLKFVGTRHPRTAVAKLRDGKFLMVIVDGRSESSGGISLFDLADYMLTLGATNAMNLDGGGSTTMYLDGKVVNDPSDPTGERKVSDAILVTLRKKKGH